MAGTPARSTYANDFVLKGGMLLASFGNRRPTVDADALARNMASDQQSVARRVVEIAEIPDPDDGVEFLTDEVTTAVIRVDANYTGVRVTMGAQLATAHVKFRLDTNFGDPVTPAPQLIRLPALRPGAESIRILGYPVETVLAEKLVTAIDLAQANTRVRDFTDVYMLTGTQTLRCDAIREAIEATASFRGVDLTSLKDTARDLGTLRATTYSAYRRGLGAAGTDLPEQFADTIAAVAAFIDPVIAGMDDRAEWDHGARRWTGGEWGASASGRDGHPGSAR